MTSLIRIMRSELDEIWSIVTQSFELMYIVYTSGVYNVYNDFLQQKIDNIAERWGKYTAMNRIDLNRYNTESGRYIILQPSTKSDYIIIGLYYLSLAVKDRLEKQYSRSALELLTKDNNLVAFSKNLHISHLKKKSLLNSDYYGDRVFIHMSEQMFKALKALKR